MKKYVIILLAATMFASCLGTKHFSEKNSTAISKEKSEKERDSIFESRINKAINDAIITRIPSAKTSDEAFNKAVNAAVDEILLKLNMKKQSGDNSYELYYDLIKRELQFRAEIGETSSTKTDVKESAETEKSFEQTTDEYISKKVNAVPWWIWLLAVLWFLPQIIDRVQLIISPVRGLLKK